MVPAGGGAGEGGGGKSGSVGVSPRERFVATYSQVGQSSFELSVRGTIVNRTNIVINSKNGEICRFLCIPWVLPGITYGPP